MKLKGHSPVDLIINNRKLIEKIYIVLIIFSLICVPMVGINYDLTKYLPDSSPSAQALDIGLDAHQRRQRAARVGKDFAAALIAIHDRQRIGDLRAQRLHGGNPRADVGGSDRHQIGDMHAALAGKAGLIGGHARAVRIGVDTGEILEDGKMAQPQTARDRHGEEEIAALAAGDEIHIHAARGLAHHGFYSIPEIINLTLFS